MLPERACSRLLVGNAAGQSYNLCSPAGRSPRMPCASARRRRVATAFHGAPRDTAVLSRVGAFPGLSPGDVRGVFCRTQLRCNKSDDDQSSTCSARAGGGLLFEVRACPSAVCSACVRPRACSRLAKPGALFPSTVSSSTWTDTMRILYEYCLYTVFIYSVYTVCTQCIHCIHTVQYVSLPYAVQYRYQNGMTREGIHPRSPDHGTPYPKSNPQTPNSKL
jgi:hypothetical protein